MSFTANPFFFTLQKHYELFILLTKTLFTYYEVIPD
jgi:hypothetical protein